MSMMSEKPKTEAYDWQGSVLSSGILSVSQSVTNWLTDWVSLVTADLDPLQIQIPRSIFATRFGSPYKNIITNTNSGSRMRNSHFGMETYTAYLFVQIYKRKLLPFSSLRSAEILNCLCFLVFFYFLWYPLGGGPNLQRGTKFELRISGFGPGSPNPWGSKPVGIQTRGVQTRGDPNTWGSKHVGVQIR